MADGDGKIETKDNTFGVIDGYLRTLGWKDPWILRITDTVPPKKRRQYQRDIRKAIQAITSQVKPVSLVHLGSFQVAFGHALEFVHLFAIPDLKTYEELMKPNLTISATYDSGTLDSKTACGHVHHVYINQNHVADSHWELLKPEDFSKEGPKDPKRPKKDKKK